MIRFTQFRDERAQTKREKEVPSLVALAEYIRSPAARTKSRLPWIKLARFSGVPSDKGCLRYDAAVVALTGCEGDYDGGTMPMQEAAERLQTAGVWALLYATPSSTPEAPRWRVLTPFSREFVGDQETLRNTRAISVARINGVLGGELAGESFVLSQSFYFGNIRGQAPIEIIVVEGSPIDLCDHLDPGALYKNRRTTPPSVRVAHAPVPEEFEESDDDPRLLAEGRRRVEWSEPGTCPQGEREFQLVAWLGDMRTSDGLILSAAGMADLMAEYYPQTTIAHIEAMLGRRSSPRGCDPEPVPELGRASEQPSAGPTEPETEAEEARAQLRSKLMYFFREAAPPLAWLITSPAGLGKTDQMVDIAIWHALFTRPDGSVWLEDIPDEEAAPQVLMVVPTNALADELQQKIWDKLKKTIPGVGRRQPSHYPRSRV